MGCRLLVAFGVLALLAAACTTAPEEGVDTTTTTTSSTTSDLTTTTTVPVPLPEAPGSTLPGGPEGFESLGELSGRLALTDGQRLVLVDPNGANEDLVDEVAAGFLSQPTWAPDGTRLGWVRLDEVASSIETVVIEDGARDQILTETTPIYLQWNDAADRIGFLEARAVATAQESEADPDAAPDPAPAPEPEQALLLRSVTLGGAPIEIETGAPLFFAWSPDNVSLTMHRGDQLLVSDRGKSEFLLDTSRHFTAPDWIDQRTVVAARDQVLVLVDTTNGLVNEVAHLAGPTRFVVTDDGSRVAYLGPDDGVQSIQLGPQKQVLHVLDLATGNDVVVTDQEVLAFEWSTDGNRLAVMGPSDFDDELYRWFFWEGGAFVGATSEFTPSEVEREVYLPFFAQYAQSHTRWSPAGDAFAFAGTVDDQSGIFVHVIGATPQSIQIASGDFVTWSPESVENGGGISPL